MLKQKTSIMLLLMIALLTMIGNAPLYAQNTVIYSDSGDDNTYSVVAPDQSLALEINPYGGRAEKTAIDGSWNRLANSITVEDRLGQLDTFDFSFGTYTELTTNSYRPVYAVSRNTSNSIALTATATIRGQKVGILRTLTLLSNGQVEEKLSLSNKTGKSVLLDFEGLAFTFGSLFDIARATSNNNNIPEYRYYNGEKIEKAKINGGSWFGGPTPMAFIDNAKWATLADNFFMTIVRPRFENSVFVYHGLEFGPKSRVSLGIQVLATNILPNQTLDYTIDYYVGPRQESAIASIDKDYKKLFAWPIVFNWLLKPIENGTTWIMTTLVEKTGSAGLTLILIAIIVKLLLLPLSIKSAISMKKMRVLQPKINKLQEKWGHDQPLLQQKTMELYKEEKANPLGGCLPLLLQIPVFFALFRVLSRSVELRGAGFLWIQDLTMPDTLFVISGFSFHLLPIIMTILQLISVVLQQGRVGSSQNDMQKQMQMQSYFMPLIFLFLFWGMPSGLVLYWTIQNIFSIIEQEGINLDSRYAKKKI